MTNLERLPDLITVKELMSILRIGQVKAYAITKEKSFPCLVIGNKKLIPKDELIEWIRDNMKGGNICG